MIENMIQSLYNIASSSIGSTWWPIIMHPKWHWVWSDSCASQFKSSKPWFFVSKYPNFTQGCKMLWSFFGSGHGKGPHDDVRIVIKRFLRREQLVAHGAKL
jgi:hypothetical protein